MVELAKASLTHASVFPFMSKRFSSLALLGAATIALAACGDSTAPVEQPRPLRAPKLTVAYTSTFSFALNPTVDNIYQSYDGTRIVIPAYSICKVGVSGYGPTTWDQPCAPATTPVVFTLKSGTDNGSPRIDVHPDVRFSPSKTVTVTFRDMAAANSLSALINYCPSGSSACVDESKTDASLRTNTNPTTGQVSRRIKHFSGYNITYGSDCETGDCGSDGFARGRGVPNAVGASGYITTTGLNAPTADAFAPGASSFHP
jgi:hypothetical protein